MIIVYILLAIITVAVIAFGIYNYLRASDLDERQEELDKFSVHLDERANRLAADEATTIKLNKQLLAELKRLEGKK